MLDKKIGILGGGQLGKMLCMAGSGMNLDIYVMDKQKDFPAGSVCAQFVEGDITEYSDVLNFGRTVDILTIEFEKINVAALFDLEKEGRKVYPSPEIISMIQDKGIQKQFYKEKHIPTSNFILFKSKHEILQSLKKGQLNFPFVQKARRDGYDGQGVLVCHDDKYVDLLFDTPSVIEELVSIEKEIAVIVCRNKRGHVSIYDPVEMVFNHEANLLDYQISPAHIENSTFLEATEMAYNIANTLELVGILAIEMFLDKTGKLILNEVAPRPHNSGHHTIESCYTSQYENHLRAILNLPLGKPDILAHSVLINLLGSPGYSGETVISGEDEILRINGSNLHLYGKKNTKPFRKMGHVTLIHEKERIPYESISRIKKSFSTAPLNI